MTARSKSSSVFRHRPQEARAETESSKPRNIVQGSVERTIAWLNRCRRLAKDWENLNCKALAFLRLASIRLMVRGAKVVARAKLRGWMRLASS